MRLQDYDYHAHWLTDIKGMYKPSNQQLLFILSSFIFAFDIKLYSVKQVLLIFTLQLCLAFDHRNSHYIIYVYSIHQAISVALRQKLFHVVFSGQLKSKSIQKRPQYCELMKSLGSLCRFVDLSCHVWYLAF